MLIPVSKYLVPMFLQHASKRRHSPWLIALLTLVFLGQPLAVMAVPCQSMGAMSMDELSMSHDMDAMDHSAMDHSAMAMQHAMNQTDSQTTHDCCKAVGHCTAAGCSVSALGHSWTFAVPSDNLPDIDRHRQPLPSSPISSLYRPPILR